MHVVVPSVVPAIGFSFLDPLKSVAVVVYLEGKGHKNLLSFHNVWAGCAKASGTIKKIVVIFSPLSSLSGEIRD